MTDSSKFVVETLRSTEETYVAITNLGLKPVSEPQKLQLLQFEGVLEELRDYVRVIHKFAAVERETIIIGGLLNNNAEKFGNSLSPADLEREKDIAALLAEKKNSQLKVAVLSAARCLLEISEIVEWGLGNLDR